MGVLVPGEAVGVEGPEDVADSAAGDGLQDSATLPDPEGHLEVLPTPDIHLLVVTSQIPERLPSHSEQPWGKIVSREERQDGSELLPPAIVGDLVAPIGEPRLDSSDWEISIQVKCPDQVKPPTWK